jgi:hypothetical protein
LFSHGVEAAFQAPSSNPHLPKSEKLITAFSSMKTEREREIEERKKKERK